MRSDWERDGYLVVPGFLDASTIEAMRAAAGQIIEDWDPAAEASVFTTDDQVRTSDATFLASGDRVVCFREDGVSEADGSLNVDRHRAVNKIGHALHDLDPVFEEVSHRSELGQVASEIGMVDPVLVQSMFICKAAGTGGEVSTHTDHTFLWTEPQTVTGFWFALDDADVTNGCLWVLPGGHRTEPIRRRFKRSRDGGTDFEVLAGGQEPTTGFVPVEVAAGTLVVLHGLLPHRSDPNRSDRRRHAYTLHAVERGARWAEDNWLRRGDLPARGFEPVSHG